ncbi:MAG: hypothetical protein VB092_04370 [Oscillospiraceae bacterium]|nr:hypothetical protein [Oscillospiraceae bacterium]
MKLSAPRFFTFLLSLIFGVAAILCIFGVVAIPVISAYPTYFLMGAYALLLLAVIFKGL